VVPDSLTIGGVPLNCQDYKVSCVAVAAEWNDWENSAHLKDWQYYGSLKRWGFRCSEQATAWASSTHKAIQDLLEAGAAVNCTFVFGGETIVNEDVYIVAVNGHYLPAFSSENTTCGRSKASRSMAVRPRTSTSEAIVSNSQLEPA